ncbi:MAG TPA: hypothetical protein VGO80_24245 [Solirubrobacteraceae bacterium]|nr:hypothetical protein [Solirubrobacteraceae bacterium]
MRDQTLVMTDSIKTAIAAGAALARLGLTAFVTVERRSNDSGGQPPAQRPIRCGTTTQRKAHSSRRRAVPYDGPLRDFNSDEAIGTIMAREAACASPGQRGGEGPAIGFPRSSMRLLPSGESGSRNICCQPGCERPRRMKGDRQLLR